MSEHGIHFGQSCGHQLTVAQVLHRIDHDLAEAMTILEKKNSQYGGQEEPPHVLQTPRSPQDQSLRRSDNILAMAHYKAIDAVYCFLAPAMLEPYLPG